MLRRLFCASLIFASVQAIAATQGGAIPVPLPLFPANNWWNNDVSAAPVDANSANFITFIGGTRRVHPDWGGDYTDPMLGMRTYGFPYIIVDGSQAKKQVTFDPQAAPESDGVGVPFYPIPDEAITQFGWIEQGPPGNLNIGGDRHMLIVDKTNNELYELYNVFYNGTSWTAYSGAKFFMNTNNRRPEGWTSADAAGLAVLPGLVRYDEVYGPNEITHAFRFTVRDTNLHVFPASHDAGSNPSALPMGTRLRLKASTNILTFPADVQKICRALMKYGLIVADNGSDMYIQGNYDNNWNMDVFNSTTTGLAKLTANDFEVVQLGWKPNISFVLTIPFVLGANDPASATLTVYDSNYNLATGYTGTVQFTSSDGAASLPMNYTFTGGDAGTHTFTNGFTLRTVGGQTVTVKDMADATATLTRNVIVGPPTPTGLAATATTGTNVNLSWNASTGATQYEILRASAGSAYSSLVTVGTTSTSDTTVTALNTYVYKVRAIDSSSRQSPLSIPDAATTMFFTDDPLVVNTTVVKAAHITELRQAVNLMRTAGGLGATSFTDPALAGISAKALHIDELRTSLTAARAAIGLPAIPYTDVTLAGTNIKAVHVQELRQGMK